MRDGRIFRMAPRAQAALQGGFEVVGVDNFSRRALVKEVGSNSAIPVSSMAERLHGRAAAGK